MTNDEIKEQIGFEDVPNLSKNWYKKHLNRFTKNLDLIVGYKVKFKCDGQKRMTKTYVTIFDRESFLESIELMPDSFSDEIFDVLTNLHGSVEDYELLGFSVYQ